MGLDKKFRRKRLLSFVIVSGYLFLGGCEDVLILPTCWDYLQTLGVTDEKWLGFTLSIYSVAAAVSGLIGGRLADKYFRHTKTIVIIGIIFRIFGNFQYMCGFNIWNILCSRFICGIAAASGTSLVAEVCRSTTVEERKKFLSFINAAFQMGLMMGPGFQILLTNLHFTIFGMEVNPLNAPGLFIAVLWLCHWVGTIFFFSNLTEEFRDIQDRQKEPDKSLITIPEENSQSANQEETPKSEEDGIYRRYMDEFLTDSYVMLMFQIFSLYFAHVAFETVIPVITQDFFGLNVNQITLIYTSEGLLALTSFIGLAYLGNRVRESTLLIVGWSLIVSGQVWLFIVVPNFEKGNQTQLVYFLLGISTIYLGSPMTNVSNSALASKVLSSETQGLGQGIRRLLTYIGLVFGPTWGGSTVHKPYLFIGACIVIMLMNAMMLAFSYRNLRAAEDKIIKSSKSRTSTDDESTPLIHESL